MKLGLKIFTIPKIIFHYHSTAKLFPFNWQWHEIKNCQKLETNFKSLKAWQENEALRLIKNENVPYIFLWKHSMLFRHL